MKRNIIYSLIPASTALFLLVSCNQDEMSGMEVAASDSPQEIRFEMAYATPTEVPDNGAPGTRVSTSTDGSYTNSWEDGDEVGVYIVKGNAGLQNTGNWVDNMKMTYSNGNWSYTLPSGKEYYPCDEALSFYAYYPYDDAFTPTSQSFQLPTDQSGQADITDMYLFTARRAGVQNSSEPVRLEFSSALAMIELSLTSGGDGGRLTDRLVVTMEECKTDFKLNLESGQAEAANTVGTFTLRRVEQPDDADYKTKYTYHALVPAQMLAGANVRFDFAYKNIAIGSKLSYRPNEAINLEAGMVNRFAITLKPVIDPTHKYKVGDIYPHKGLPMGMVYEVGSDGQSGKIVYYEYTYTTWGKEMDITTDRNLGRQNMRAVYAANGNSFDGFPPFQWVDNLNPTGTKYEDNDKKIWYLPAVYELQALCRQWDLLADSFEKLSFPDKSTKFVSSHTGNSSIAFAGVEFIQDQGHYDWAVFYGLRKSQYGYFAVMEF